MNKKFTLFLVIAALLLALPSQAQHFSKKKSVQKTSLTKLSDHQLQVRQSSKSISQMKAKQVAALKSRQTAPTRVAIGSGKSSAAQSVKAAGAKTTKDKAFISKLRADSKSFKQWNWAKNTPKFFTKSKLACYKMPAKTTKNLKSVSRKQSATLKAVRRVLSEENGVVTDVPEDGTLMHYQHGGMFYYDGTLYGEYGTYEDAVVDQSTDIVEMADGTVYIRDFLSQTSYGTWVKGTKEGNTITIPVGQRVY